MYRVIVRRILQMPVAILAVLFIVFMFLMTTGDPVEMLASPMATDSDKAQIRGAYGLDKPLVYQFIIFVSKAGRGDFGESFFRGEPALQLVLRRFPASLQLALAATAVALAISIPLGVIAAVKRGTMVDQLVMLFSLVGQSVANFWLALMLILVFAVWLKWLPVSGRQGISYMVLPVLALCVWQLALIARLTRSGMLEVLGEDYIRTAHAKGLRLRTVLTRHALRNALLPIVTVTGLSLGWLLGGAIVIEKVFAWPGLGSLLIDSVLRRDYPVVLAGVTVLATMFIFINLVVDLLYVYLDPRIRY